MVPSKSKRSSTRRSSILKPPKPRHPLQNLNFTSSSTENSPATTKIKRRVSFAEKKHVKEFCNSLEQGTVWNNTYEEHDLSSQKASHSSNQEEYNEECMHKENSNSEVAQACSVQESIVRTISSETCNINQNIDDFELSFTNVVQSAESMLAVLNQKDILSNAPFTTLENSEAWNSILGSSIPAQNTSHVSQPITVYEDPDDMPNKVSELPQSDLNTLQCNKLNTTAVQDTHMEFTEVVSNAVYHDFKTMVPNTTMEFTEAIPASLNILEDKENIRDPDLHYRLITSNTVATTEEHFDMSMELTSAISPCIIKSINDVETTVYSANDKTKLSDLSMEITAVVSNIPCNLQIENCDINSIPKDDDDNRNAIFNDVSMEMTEAVKTNPPKDMTCLIDDCNRLVVSQNAPKYTDNVTSMNEKTELLNLPMEITAVIPGNICLMNDNEDNIKSDVKGSRENKSSDILQQCDKTEICNNEVMEFTTAIEAVPTTNFYNSKDNSEDTDINLYTDKTRIFLNNSMAVTAVVSSLNSKDNHEEELIVRESNNENSNRTALFPNTSMEMTEVVEKPQDNMEVENPVVSAEVNIDKTKICNNETMEFTRAIEALPTTNSYNLKDNSEYNDINVYTDKTRIFLNNSMTVTAVVSKGNHEEEVIVRESNNENSNRTALFPNTSMEMTEVVEKPQDNMEVEFPVVSTEVRQSELSGDAENIPGQLDQSPVSMNILKDITRIIVPSVFDSKCGSEKGDPAIDNSVEKIVVDVSKETPIDDAQNTASLAPSTALHESNDKDASAALNESNTVTACAPINPVLSDALPATSSTERARDIRFNPRRTYTIQQSDVDHSCTGSNEKNDRSFELDTRTFSYNANNNENSVQAGQTNAENFQNNLRDYEDLIVHEGSENLESIDPPSFLCSDNSFSKDVEADVIDDREVDTKSIGNVTNLNTMWNNLGNIIEPVRRAEMCLIRSMSAGTDENKSVIEHAEQAQPNEAAPCQLSRVSCSSTDSSILKLTSSTINDSNKLPKFTIEKDCRDVNERVDVSEGGNVSAENIQSLPGNGNLSSNSRLNVDENPLIVADTEMTDANKENIESHTCSMEKDVSVVLDPFSALLNKLKLHSESDDIIWSVYHENIERNMFAIGFIACSLLVVILLTDDCDAMSNRRVKEIKVISRLADDSDALLCIVHRLILEKLDTTGMMIVYETEENILPMLDYISGEVKMAMDFMLDVKSSFDLNLMQINRDSISFVSWTSRMDIILKIKINIKPFDRIEARDISVQCLLGSVREEDIRKLIKNIKRDHTFVRRFMNDVRDYIYIIEDSAVKTTY